jgi:hypothetical protein
MNETCMDKKTQNNNDRPKINREMDVDVVDEALATEQQRRRRYMTVIVMRHGVALHNVPDPATHHPRRLDDPALTDPPLIETGRMQAVQAGTRIAEWWRRQQHPLYGCGGNGDDTPIDLVVVSPLSRCIETAVLAFVPGTAGTATTSTGPPSIRRFVCHEDVREAFGRHYPDKRSEKSILEVRLLFVVAPTHAPAK